MLDEHSFALCLTHDVDRPYKRLHHALYYAIQERSLDHLRSIVGTNPYWQFETITALESDLGVRSAFYFLDEPHLFRGFPREDLFDPENWIQHLGRYDPTAPEIAETIRDLDTRGWEVGLHGTYHAATDGERMATELRRLESVLGHEIRGIRQHYLRLDVPETWRTQAELGLEYDASLGSGTDYGFEHGYGLLRPLDRSFLVFPLTLMEQTLPDPKRDFDAAWTVCADLLAEAERNDAVMTVLWHPRYFSDRDFPGYTSLYRRLIETAQAAGAWVGSPGQLLDALDENTRAEITTVAGR